jgi:hypothetical protein
VPYAEFDKNLLKVPKEMYKSSFSPINKPSLNINGSESNITPRTLKISQVRELSLEDTQYGKSN